MRTQLRALTPAIAAASIALFSSTPTLAATFVSSTVRTTAVTQLRGVTDTQTDHADTVSPGVISATSQSSQQSDVATVMSKIAVTADWTSATAGSVAIDWGWDADTSFTRYQAKVSTEEQQLTPNWSYTFIASHDGVFNLTSSVVGEGFGVGLQPLRGAYSLVSWTSGGTISDPTANSAYSFDLIGGQTYTVGVHNVGNLIGFGGLTAKGQASADIDWSITYVAVPEPSAWALMILGFGAAGGALRRRRLTIA